MNEWDKMFYAPNKGEDVAELTEEAPTAEAQVAEEQPVAEVPVVAEPVIAAEAVIEPVAEVAPVIETPAPYKTKKFIEVEDEKQLFESLNKKYSHERMKPEEKALAFLREQNPELDDSELSFIAMTEYGIGFDPLSDDELSDQQKIELQKQSIAKKKLLKQADDFFQSEASKVTLPDYDPLDLDPDYKSYRTESQKRSDDEKQRTDKINYINTELDTNANLISEITDSTEIDLDEGKFALDIKFKLDENKQKQLADFAKRYQPTAEEYNAFNDPKTGKFDYKGYVQSLAPIVFAKEIKAAGLRQALAKDRQHFVEHTLKNSTLRNNDVSQVTASEKLDANESYWKAAYGK